MAEPVTTAILAAIAAGATAGATDTVKKAMGDAYAALKGLLVRKFGGQSKAVEAVNKLEEDRNSTGWKETVGKKLNEVGANQDQELITAAKAVLAKLKELPQKEQNHIMQAIGSNIAQADRGGTAKVTVNRKV